MYSLPTASHVPPIHPSEPPKADLRRDITAWRCLVWAYADELAHAAVASQGSRYANTGFASSNWDRSVAGFEHAGVSNVHEDALLVHGKLRAWFSGDGAGLSRIVFAAERRLRVAPAIHVARVRACPRLGRDDRPVERKDYRHGRVAAHYCLVDWEGEQPEKADAMERAYGDFYALFLAFLDVMPGFPLVKWKVGPRGLDG